MNFDKWFNKHHAVKTAYGSDYFIGAQRGFEAGQKSKQAEIDLLKKEIKYLNDARKNQNGIILDANSEIKSLNKKIKLLLCDKHVSSCSQSKGLFNSGSTEDEPCLICLAESNQAKLVRVESGEYAIVPKEPSLQMKQAAYKQYDTGLNSITEIYQAMIEAAQEQNND